MAKRSGSEVQNFDCAICLETHPVEEEASVASCHFHSFCKDSLKDYLLYQMSEGVLKIRCPADRCRTYFRDEEIEALVTSVDKVSKYKRMKLLAENEHYRECSKCLSVNSLGSLDQPNLTCSTCNHKFCFVHGDSHGGIDCTIDASEEKATAKTIKDTTRSCPKETCSYRIEKDGGCTSMICRCGQVCKAMYVHDLNISEDRLLLFVVMC